MTENKKRFTIIGNNSEIGVKEHKSGDVIVLTHRDLNSEQFVAQIVTFLNEQNEAIEKLIAKEKYWEQKAIQRINYLEEENEQLKQAEILANHRGEMISFANSLIDDLGSETMKEMWDKFKNEKYEKWCELE